MTSINYPNTNKFWNLHISLLILHLLYTLNYLAHRLIDNYRHLYFDIKWDYLDAPKRVRIENVEK